MLSRRCPSPTLSRTKNPSPSGPRWRSRSVARASTSRSTCAASPGSQIPTIPHMGNHSCGANPALPTLLCSKGSKSTPENVSTRSKSSIAPSAAGTGIFLLTLGDTGDAIGRIGRTAERVVPRRAQGLRPAERRRECAPHRRRGGPTVPGGPRSRAARPRGGDGHARCGAGGRPHLRRGAGVAQLPGTSGPAGPAVLLAAHDSALGRDAARGRSHLLSAHERLADRAGGCLLSVPPPPVRLLGWRGWGLSPVTAELPDQERTRAVPLGPEAGGRGGDPDAQPGRTAAPAFRAHLHADSERSTGPRRAHPTPGRAAGPAAVGRAHCCSEATGVAARAGSSLPGGRFRRGGGSVVGRAPGHVRSGRRRGAKRPRPRLRAPCRNGSVLRSGGGPRLHERARGLPEHLHRGVEPAGVPSSPPWTPTMSSGRKASAWSTTVSRAWRTRSAATPVDERNGPPWRDAPGPTTSGSIGPRGSSRITKPSCGHSRIRSGHPAAELGHSAARRDGRPEAVARSRDTVLDGLPCACGSAGHPLTAVLRSRPRFRVSDDSPGDGCSAVRDSSVAGWRDRLAIPAADLLTAFARGRAPRSAVRAEPASHAAPRAAISRRSRAWGNGARAMDERPTSSRRSHGPRGSTRGGRRSASPRPAGWSRRRR